MDMPKTPRTFRTLPDTWVTHLLTLPESGMGYQRVDVQFADGTLLTDVLVYDSTDMDLPTDFLFTPIAGITLHTDED